MFIIYKKKFLQHWIIVKDMYSKFLFHKNETENIIKIFESFLKAKRMSDAYKSVFNYFICLLKNEEVNTFEPNANKGNITKLFKKLKKMIQIRQSKWLKKYVDYRK